jgi:integrase
VLIRHSKTDQEGQGQTIAIPRGYRLRPVEHRQAWLAAAAITAGPVFRPTIGNRVADGPLSGYSVAVAVQRRCALAGIDPAAFSAHSLRSGFLTSAAESGASIFKMMETSRHRSMDTLRGYVRSADLFREHAGSAFL